jgi:Fe2+ or Zn2+ uptake regulation protein
MTHHLLNYAARLREHGLRLTPQREMILGAICDGGGPAAFDEIYARLHARAPAIN